MKKRKLKKENLFCIISFLFILGCCIFYGARLIHYYKVFNPSKKDSHGLLSIEIPKSSTLVTEGDGLYGLNGSYIYRGDVKDNYIKYNGLMFRILRINYGSNTEIILDHKINILAYGADKSYDKSDIALYLNDYFVESLNKDHLEKMEICVDVKDELSDNQKKKCKNTYKTYSTLIDSNTYLSTVHNDVTYLNNDGSLIYLRDKINGELGNVIANNTQLSYVNGAETYDIKPIISLKYDTKILSGTGTKDDPYIVDDDNYLLGSKKTLGSYDWIVIEEGCDYLKLALDGTLETLKPYGSSFDVNDENSIAYYLNNEFYNSLDFKDQIIDSNFETGPYNGNYKSIADYHVNTHVGLLSIKDFKMDTMENQYLLLNTDKEDKVYAVDSNMYLVDKNLSKAIRPVITIKDTTNKKDGCKEVSVD